MALSWVCHGASFLSHIEIKFYSVLLGSSCINACLAEVGCENLFLLTDFQFHLNGRLSLSRVGNMQIGRFSVDVFYHQYAWLVYGNTQFFMFESTSFEKVTIQTFSLVFRTA